MRVLALTAASTTCGLGLAAVIVLAALYLGVGVVDTTEL